MKCACLAVEYNHGGQSVVEYRYGVATNRSTLPINTNSSECDMKEAFKCSATPEASKRSATPVKSEASKHGTTPVKTEKFGVIGNLIKMADGNTSDRDKTYKNSPGSKRENRRVKKGSQSKLDQHDRMIWTPRLRGKRRSYRSPTGKCALRTSSTKVKKKYLGSGRRRDTVHQMALAASLTPRSHTRSKSRCSDVRIIHTPRSRFVPNPATLEAKIQPSHSGG